MCKQLRGLCCVDMAIMVVSDGVQTSTVKKAWATQKNTYIEWKYLFLCVINVNIEGNEMLAFPHNLSEVFSVETPCCACFPLTLSADVVFWSFLFFPPPCCVQFELQKLRIYCDPEQSNRETACEIPGVVSTKSCFALHSFTFVVWKKEISLRQPFLTLSNTSVSVLKCICTLSSSLKIIGVYCMA